MHLVSQTKLLNGKIKWAKRGFLEIFTRRREKVLKFHATISPLSVRKKGWISRVPKFGEGGQCPNWPAPLRPGLPRNRAKMYVNEITNPLEFFTQKKLIVSSH